MNDLTIPPACIARDLGYVLLDHNNRKAYRYCNVPSANFLNSAAYQNKSGVWWPKAKAINPLSIGQKNIPGLSLFEVDYIDHVFYWPEMSVTDRRLSLIFLSDICIYLAQHDIGLHSHLWNLTLQKGSPFFIDLGDFKQGCDGVEMTATLESILRESMESHHGPVHPSEWISNWPKISTSIRELKLNTLNSIYKCKAFKSIMEDIEVLSGDHYWDSYPVQLNMPRNAADIIPYAESHRPALCNFIRENSPHTVTDLGCSRGLYSFYCNVLGASCVGIDYSHELIADANSRAKELNLLSSFSFLDLLNPQPYGINGAYGSFMDRLKSEMVIAPAVIHHLHGLGKSLPSVITLFTQLSKKYLALEFISPDGRGNHINLLDVQKILRSEGFLNIKVKDSYPFPRKWIFATKL